MTKFGDDSRERLMAFELRCKTLMAERDEARWRLCKVIADGCDRWGCDIARSYGWDYLADGKEETSDANPQTGIQYGDIE